MGSRQKLEQKIDGLPTSERMNNQNDLAFERLMQVQGECKIQSYQLLKINYPKAIFLTLLLILSVIGLLLLKYSIKLRSMVFYNSCSRSQATNLYIKGSEKSEEIVELVGNKFEYKKLVYLLNEDFPIPLSFAMEENFSQISNESYLKMGLRNETVGENRKKYGENWHQVQIPSFLEFMFDKLTNPFMILQYIFCVAFIVGNYVLFGVTLIAFAFITTIINYILLYRSYRKIQQMAQRLMEVDVIRQGQKITINSTELVPGDVYIPDKQIVCDAIVLKGDAFVNEANLTGESYPIGKFAITSFDSIYESQSWVYEGSHVYEKAENIRAVVINTGFTTKRGRIIRRILTRQMKEPKIYRSALLFVGQSAIVCIITFGIYLGIAQAYGITMEVGYQILMFFDILSAFIPSPLPIYFNLNYSFSLARLRAKNILGTTLEKTVEGALTKVFCFDKTGTITEQAVNIKGICKVDQNNQIKAQFNEIKDELMMKLLGTCHATREIEGKFEGDEIDREIFEFSQYTMHPNKSTQAVITVKNESSKILQILKINQFQSRFQSMSVLVKDPADEKFYVFVKGAPERIYQNSTNKPTNMIETVESLSLSGFRTIAVGYKIISAEFVQSYMKAERTLYEKEIKVLGLVAFENKVKQEAKETMQKLKESNIQTKIITGDNIYIAVETALRSGILSQNERVLLLEGKKQLDYKEGKKIFEGTVLEKTSTVVKQEKITLDHNSYETQELSIAVDNDFLELIPPPKLPDKVVIFARIPPENKAVIVKRIKQQFIDLYADENSCRKLFRMDRPKVGMCGDGANDLLALKEADLSLGIQECDASYTSSFTINSLLDVDEVIRESKNNMANIVQFFFYIISTYIASQVAIIIMAINISGHAPNARFYYNFTSMLLFPLLISLSRPSSFPTPYVPVSNFMSLYSHLNIWGNSVIAALPLIFGYLYFKTTGDWSETSRDSVSIDQQVDQTGTDGTMMFVVGNFLWTSSVLALYWGDPWKIRFYQHIPILVLFAINCIVGTVFFFTTEQIAEAFGFTGIEVSTGAVLFGITMGGVLLQLLYTKIVHSFQLYKTKL